MNSSHPQFWYTRREGRVRGPFPATEVTRYVLLGRIRLEDELSADGERWQPLSAHPDLIPDVMKHAGADEASLAAARAAVDERTGRDRRGTRRMTPPAIERRRGERRAPEDPLLAAHRAGLRRRAVGGPRLSLLAPLLLVVVAALLLLV